MPTGNHPDDVGLADASKMDVIVTALEVLVLQMQILDLAGLAMASAHLNEAIERLRVERVALANKLNI